MEISRGDILLVAIGDSQIRWTVSAVDGQVVKLFDENGKYRQIPYTNLQEMSVQGQVKILSQSYP